MKTYEIIVREIHDNGGAILFSCTMVVSAHDGAEAHALRSTAIEAVDKFIDAREHNEPRFVPPKYKQEA